MKSRSLLFSAKVATLTVVYFGVARLGLLLSIVLGHNTLVWPPTGIALAALLLFGPQLWPGIALGAFLASAATGVPLAVACGVSVGNTLEALCAVFLLQRVVGFQPALERLQDVLGLVVLAAGLSTMVSATIDVASLCLGGVAPWDAYGLLWQVWWLGGAMSDLVLAPLLLTWNTRVRMKRRLWRLAETGVLAASLVLVCLLVFGGWSRLALIHASLDYAVFPFIIWAALRFSPREAITATFVVSAIALWGTAYGFGPFVRGTVHERLLLLYTFLSVTATTTLVMAAIVTERKRAEEEVRRSAEYFRALTENASDIITILNGDGTVRYVSPSAERLLGYVPQDSLGKDGFGFVHPDDVPGLANAFAEAIQKPGVALQRSEFRLRHKNGAWRTFDCVGKNLLDNPAVAGLVVNSCDITEQVQAEAALRQAYKELERRVEERTAELAEANARLRQEIAERQEAQAELIRLSTAVRMSTDSIVLCDLEGRIIEANEATLKMYGATNKDDLQGKSAFELIVPKDRIRAFAGMEETLEQGFIQNREYQIILKDGRTIPVEMSVALMKDASGKVTGFVGISRDISERKQAAETLRRSEEHFRLLIENALDIIILLNSDGTVRYQSPSAERVLGYKPGEVLGTSGFAFIHPDDLPRVIDTFAAMLQQPGILPPLELRVQHKDGSWHVIETLGNNLLNNPAVEGIIINVRDITERKHMEAELRQVLAELRRSNEELQQFAYIVSHDLQEPLRTIIGFLQLLANRYQGKLDTDAEEFIRYASEGATRMQSLIQDLLAYARVESRELELRATECTALVQRTLSDLQRAITESGATITLDPLPTVQTDAQRLRLVFQNLISNALKFRSTARPCVHISAHQEGASWVFAVRDNGIGIDPKQAERIFQVFQRLHLHREYPGTGMGLAICKKVIERHGGRIWVESEVGKGATFFFSLPATMGPERALSARDLREDRE
jgi:PAS domain S-box-containing protein